MVFGQTSRLGWGGDPRPIWKLWDNFGMEGCEMVGWWDPRSAVSCSNPDIYATMYRKAGKVLISLASWAAKNVATHLQADWSALGLNPQNVIVTQPAVDGIQDAKLYGLDDAIPVSQTKGVFLILEEHENQNR